MALSKGKKLTSEFDLTEGYVSEIKWDHHAADLLITVYYYLDDHNNKYLMLRFKNCRKAVFTMPKAFETIPKDEIKNYLYSWYTITGYDVKKEHGIMKVSIKTVDENPRWLNLECEEIWVKEK